MEKGGKAERNHTLFHGLRNPYRNLKSENSQDYACPETSTNCTFMNSASEKNTIISVKFLPCH
jgi:hypothetical protein